MKIKFLSVLLLACGLIQAQEYYPVNDGVKAESDVAHAFTNATIVVSPTRTINNATLVVRDGKVQTVGQRVSIPRDAVTHDMTGYTLQPSFIDAYNSFGVAEPKSAGSPWSGQPQYDAARQGHYWNDHIRPEQAATDTFKYNDKQAKTLREAGFGVVNTFMPDGIMRGTGSLVALSDNAVDGMRILDPVSGNYLSLDKSRQSRQSYPTSLMGALALLRQTYYDAQWYKGGNSETRDLSLEALLAQMNEPQIMDAGNKSNVLRVAKVSNKFNQNYIIVADSDAYEMADAIKETSRPLIVRVNLPDAYDVSNPYQEQYVSLEDMLHWKQSPSNLAMLKAKGIPFAITMDGHKKASDFLNHVRKSIEMGLSREDALAALTTMPAEWLRASNQVGTLESGMWANFTVSDKHILDDGATVYEHWVQGMPHVLKDRKIKNIDGSYSLVAGGTTYNIDLSKSLSKPKATVTTKDSLKIGSTLAYSDDWVTIAMTAPDTTKTDFFRFTGRVKASSGNIEGRLVTPRNTDQRAVLVLQPADADKKMDNKSMNGDQKKDLTAAKMPQLLYPNVGYGNKSLPRAQDMLIRNATVWTNTDQGILKNTDVLVKDGKIDKIGTNLSAGNATVVDGTGKHLTTGIIDEHSHIGISGGVNEAGHNSTAEVTIEDVVDHESINLYRNLAGGVTSVQLLHGSANPIGGRSAIIKLKWGYTPDEMIYENSPQFIKFALGENVKQSNWGSRSRFPQTRMGVEQVFVDYFTRAKEYETAKKSGNYRHDEEMEVILQILNGERFVTSHSYIQSEINMLMKVAERFGFNVNTFTHILEGYKVADKMKEHGVAGSTFSDWWAYKYEVNDAIPYNGAIMHREGVLVAFNSDDAEMSRRLNQEAAKAIKYGGISEEDAWKFVTLNPAKILHIDDRVGSIAKGKDADLVLWSDHPMSVYAHAEKTIIEGAVFFDRKADAQKRNDVRNMRAQLVTEMLVAKNKGLKTQQPKKSEKTEYHCDTLSH